MKVNVQRQRPLNGRVKPMKLNGALNVVPERIIVHKRSRFSPIRGLTAERLAKQLENFRAGYLRELAETMDVIEERDDTLQAVAPKRKQAVARYSFEILTQDFAEDDAALTTLAEQQVEALTYFYNNLRATSAMEQDQRGGFSLLVRQMMDAVGKRYSVHEIVWKKEGPYYTAEFWHCPLSFFENLTGKLRFIEQELGITGVDMEPGAWLVTVGQGIMIACAVAYMFKHLPLKDWLGYCDKFGFPGVHGKSKAGKGTPEWMAMVEATRNFAIDWAAVTSADESIELIEAKGGGTNLPFPPLVERMDRAMATLWRGADLGTMSKGNDAVGASVQASETDILEADDAQLIAETLAQVDRLVLDYTFGPDVPTLAYVSVAIPKPSDADQEIKINDHLVRNGVKLSKKVELERFGRTEATAAGDEFGQQPAAQMPGAGNPQPATAQNIFQAAVNAVTANQQKKLTDEAKDQLAAAIAEDLAPIRTRMAKIAAINDGEKMLAELRRFRSQLPELLKALNAKPESAAVLAQAMAAGWFNGVAAAAEGQK